MNILITSAGRRVELVKEFKERLELLSPESLVFTTDLCPDYSAACHVSDASFVAPRVTDPSYPEFLIDLCVSEKISLIIPTIDTELQVLADIKDKFTRHNISIISCSSEFVSRCRDKRKTHLLYDQLGIKYPAIYSPDNLTFPVFCKPYDGSCSIGAKLINSLGDLTNDLLHDKKNMFMEFVGSNFTEYTCDAYYDRNSDLKCVVPRERIEVRAGEVSKGVTRKNYIYQYLVDRIRKVPGAFGCVTYQLFCNPDTEEVKALEINPRFGGGYPLTSAAGYSFAEFLIREYLLGEDISFVDNWSDGLVMLRYDAKILTNE